VTPSGSGNARLPVRARDLAVTAEEQLGGELARYWQKVHEWIDTYADSGWLGTTPGYALRQADGLADRSLMRSKGVTDWAAPKPLVGTVRPNGTICARMYAMDHCSSCAPSRAQMAGGWTGTAPPGSCAG
jgi:hypothetical protein